MLIYLIAGYTFGVVFNGVLFVQASEDWWEYPLAIFYALIWPIVWVLTFISALIEN